MGMFAGRSVGPSVAAGMSPRLKVHAARPADEAVSVTCVTGVSQAQGVRTAPSAAKPASPCAQAPCAAAPPPPELLELQADIVTPVASAPTGTTARPATTKTRRRMVQPPLPAMLIRPAAVGYTLAA